MWRIDKGEKFERKASEGIEGEGFVLNSQRGTEDIMVKAQFSQIMEQQKVLCLCGKRTTELKD